MDIIDELGIISPGIHSNKGNNMSILFLSLNCSHKGQLE